jgi:tRNA pseudouridine55 synthase
LIIDGILNLNKPAGCTSFQMVALVRKLSKQRRVGHAGTLDPDATGVLPICLGQATRLVEFLMDGTKTYWAEVRLGVSTDTYDASGTTMSVRDFSGVNLADVEAILPTLTGFIRQVAPPFSAAKHEGIPLYRLARAGAPVPPKTKTVGIRSIRMLAWRPPDFEIEVECGRGTYVRSLAHDIGEALGCGAHVRAMCRLRCGVFKIEDATPVEDTRSAFLQGDYSRILHPIDAAVQHLPSVVLDRDAEDNVVNGRPVLLPDNDLPSTLVCRAYTASGQLVALLRRGDGERHWHTYKAFARPRVA